MANRRIGLTGKSGYNYVMTRLHRVRLLIVLTFFVALFVTGALWLRGTLWPDYGRRLPPPTSQVEVSPLLTPTPSVAPPPSSALVSGGAVLLWVVLGIMLALIITFVMLRWYRRTVQ